MDKVVLNDSLRKLTLLKNTILYKQLEYRLSRCSHPIVTIFVPVILTTGVAFGMLRVIDISKSDIIKHLRINDVIQIDSTS